MSIIAACNNKGGVGKTTCAVNLAVAMAREGKKVLVIDMDPQCDASDVLVQEVERDKTLFHLLSSHLNGNQVSVHAYVHETRFPGVFCIPNHTSSAWLEEDFFSGPRPPLHLVRTLIRGPVLSGFCHVVLDTPPNMGIYVTQSLIAADLVLVPVEAGSKRSVKGLDRALQTIREIRESATNSDLRFLRLVLNQVERSRLVSRAVIDRLYADLGAGHICATHIPRSTSLQQAEALNEPVLTALPHSVVSIAFQALAKEIITITAGVRNGR